MARIQSCQMCGASLGVKAAWHCAVDNVGETYSYLTPLGTNEVRSVRWVCAVCRGRMRSPGEDAGGVAPAPEPSMDVTFLHQPHASAPPRPADHVPLERRRRNQPPPDWNAQMSTAVTCFTEVLAQREERIRQLEALHEESLQRVKKATSTQQNELRHLRWQVSRLEMAVTSRDAEVAELRAAVEALLRERGSETLSEVLPEASDRGESPVPQARTPRVVVAREWSAAPAVGVPQPMGREGAPPERPRRARRSWLGFGRHLTLIAVAALLSGGTLWGLERAIHAAARVPPVATAIPTGEGTVVDFPDGTHSVTRGGVRHIYTFHPDEDLLFGAQVAPAQPVSGGRGAQ